MTDINRAARFYFLQRARFGGKPDSNSFPVTPIKGKAIKREALQRYLDKAHRRLEQVTIENLPYPEVITRYNRSGTLFYLDPPYYGCEDYYGKNLFSREDFQKMADQLGGIKGRFILSINNHPEIRRIFARFKIEEIETKYSLSKIQKVTELLISNR
jgi:DNA adenine methylase